MTEAAAKSALAPFLTDLRKAVLEGFSAYSREYTGVSHLHNARTRACIIHDHIVANVKNVPGTGIKFLPSKIRNLFTANGAAILQFKKLGRTLKPSNYPTQLALNFDAQVTTGYLPGLESSPRLTIGFVPDVSFTSIVGVYVVYILNKKLMWSFQIPDSGEGHGAIIAPLFAPPMPARKVKPKKIINPSKLNRDATG